MKKNLMIILSVAIPLITACKQEPVINFSEDSVDNIYLTCKERGKEYWRNVIIDKINKSVKSEKYFIAGYDNKVYQYGKIASLSDQGEYYYWSEPEDKMYYSFRLDRTSLKMTVDAWFNEDFSYKYFNCTKHSDYSYFKVKEKIIIEKLRKEAKTKEEAKKI
jgi:hypothetical protein